MDNSLPAGRQTQEEVKKRNEEVNKNRHTLTLTRFIGAAYYINMFY